MRILLYGFGPHRQFSDNVTERILRRIAKRRGLTTVVFPIKFDRSQFVRAVTKHSPEWIVGLGQCSRGRLLRIETRAMNKRRHSKREKARPIVPRGAVKLFTNLRPELGRDARQSRNAGAYVCNFSLYVILETLRRRRLGTRCGFIHIPYDYDPGKAARLVDGALGRMVKQEFGREGEAAKATARKKTATSISGAPRRISR